MKSLLLFVGGTCFLLNGVLAQRPKIKDDAKNPLLNISDIPVGSCGGDSYFGVGIMNGSLEKCEDWEKTDPADVAAYEEYKCSHLRVHARVVNGKCECSPNWKGPICNEYIGCEEGWSLHRSVCTPNVCQHDGELALGEKQIECICQGPWDGRYCDRLACWRLTNHGQDKRFANDGDKCKCGSHYTGENCDVVLSCYHGIEVVDGKCDCPEGWGGEICDRKCPVGQLTCTSVSLSASLILLLSLLVFRQ